MRDECPVDGATIPPPMNQSGGWSTPPVSPLPGRERVMSTTAAAAPTDRDGEGFMRFHSLYSHGFARVAACTADVHVADPLRNADSIISVARRCSEQGVAVALFPELSMSGYALDDLLGQDAVLDAVHQGLARILEASTDLLPVLIVGAPLRHRARLFNTAVVIHRGDVLGVIPKLHLPNYREFYERRQFASGHGIIGLEIDVAGRRAPFGADLLFEADDVNGLTIGVEICEDMFMPVPPSTALALAGATVLVNLSGSPITIGRAETRSLLCRSQSMRCLAAYLYAAAGQGESTTDLSWDGQTSIFESGSFSVRVTGSPRTPS